MDDEFRENFFSSSSGFYNNYESSLYSTLVDSRDIPFKAEFQSLTHIGPNHLVLAMLPPNFLHFLLNNAILIRKFF